MRSGQGSTVLKNWIFNAWSEHFTTENRYIWTGNYQPCVSLNRKFCKFSQSVDILSEKTIVWSHRPGTKRTSLNKDDWQFLIAWISWQLPCYRNHWKYENKSVKLFACFCLNSISIFVVSSIFVSTLEFSLSKVFVCFVRHIKNRQGRFLCEQKFGNTQKTFWMFGVKETRGNIHFKQYGIPVCQLWFGIPLQVALLCKE